MYQVCGVTPELVVKVRISPSRRSTMSPPAATRAALVSPACRVPVAVSGAKANSEGRPSLAAV